ncbi:hypothetical protein SOMG_04092 [Schizosaccharomyces osmophilus]|uniref:Uncharacterized protein n=1 Tax=Schizosaccharomyces osmophilus TaxID=2545709 RepID=A0AAE9WHA4_9SCHI|nr:uncharacterized protein SOMG_04092 [Schizosaccharomyces osmophilus]WBW74997.1 hypothetical protein SOMG_04092 [Schizosaccharomyces osmophilus]
MSILFVRVGRSSLSAPNNLSTHPDNRNFNDLYKYDNTQTKQEKGTKVDRPSSFNHSSSSSSMLKHKAKQSKTKQNKFSLLFSIPATLVA